MIEDFEERHHEFDGCFNFRDIGGYPTEDGRRVKWGRYFRAGRQDRMSEADLQRLSQLNVGAQIDLRGNEEISDQGRGPLPEMGADYHHLPVIPEGGREKLSLLVGDTGISGERYLGYLSFGPETWLTLFDILAEQRSDALVIHCTAGKDRTGVSTAFLLSALGVGRKVIEADYLLTNRDVVRQVDFVESTVGLPDDITREQLLVLAGVPETAMSVFLDGLESQYGGALEYLRQAGVTDDHFEAVRERFLD